MKLTLYQVDAFTNKLFSGNPAAVIPLKEWLDDNLMHKIALENNLSETVFFVPSSQPDADYDIRWFTPQVEINLCGHATLASAFVLFEILQFQKEEIVFNSKSGLLSVHRNNGLILMNFPSWKPIPFIDFPVHLPEILGVGIVNVFKKRDLLIELENEAAVKKCSPDFTALKKMGDKIIITAAGDTVDFVSRFFAPSVGINEDPVTGSAHSQLIPYWSAKLHKAKLHARQISQRGGEIWCEQLKNERVLMGGQCIFYMKGDITL